MACPKRDLCKWLSLADSKGTCTTINRPGGHWKTYLIDKRPYEPYRLWRYDWKGFRKDDWHSAPNECSERIEKTVYATFYSRNDHELIPLKDALEDHKINHPERLLREYLYRDPKMVIEQKKRSKQACYSLCKCPYKPPSTKKIDEPEIKRYQFMSNNYTYFDDGYAADFSH